MFSPFGSLIRTSAMSGSVSVSTTLTSISRVAPLRVQRRAGDEDVDAGDVLLGAVPPSASVLQRAAATASVPRRRCSGLSTPLASAISRQLRGVAVGRGRRSRAACRRRVTRCTPKPACARVVGFWPFERLAGLLERQLDVGADRLAVGREELVGDGQRRAGALEDRARPTGT